MISILQAIKPTKPDIFWFESETCGHVAIPAYRVGGFPAGKDTGHQDEQGLS